MLGNGYYVHPIPFFANKYQQYFKLENVTSVNLQTGEVLSPKFTDQYANQVKVLLVDNSNRPISSIQKNTSGSIIVKNIDNQSVENENIKVLVFQKSESGTQLVWSKNLTDIQPSITTENSLYQIDELGFPVWLPHGEISLKLNSNNPEVGNEYIGFSNELFVFSSQSDISKRASDNYFKYSSKQCSEADWNSFVSNKSGQPWVKVYYDIIKEFFFDTDKGPGNIHFSNCYTVMDTKGNLYYSDYDMHNYYYSQTHKDEFKRGQRWWPSWTDKNNFYSGKKLDESARQVISHYLVSGLHWPSPPAGNEFSKWSNTQNTMRSLYSYSSNSMLTNRINNINTNYADVNMSRTKEWDFIQHGAHDDWSERNNYGMAEVNMGPQGNLTMFVPNINGGTDIYSMGENDPTIDQERLCECLGVNWQEIYPEIFYAPSSHHIKGSSILKVIESTGRSNWNACTYWSDKNSKQCTFNWDINNLFPCGNYEESLAKYSALFKELRLDPTKDAREVFCSLFEIPKIVVKSCSDVDDDLDEGNNVNNQRDSYIDPPLYPKNQIILYPNPIVDQTIKIQITGGNEVEFISNIEILDLTGSKIFEQSNINLFDNEASLIFHNGLKSGVYLVKIYVENEYYFQKISVLN